MMKIARRLIFIVAMVALAAFIGVLKSGLHRLFREGFWFGLAGCLICIGVTVILAAFRGRAVANADPDDNALPLKPEIKELAAKFPGPITLNVSRAKWWFVTASAFGMTAASAFVGVVVVLALRAGQNGAGIGLAISALGIGFFGLCTVAGVRLLRNGSLQLDEDGFGFSGLFRRRYRWIEVSNFGVVRSKVASVVFATTKRDRSIWSSINSFYAGGRDGRLPDTYCLGAEELVQLLRAWQSAALARKGGYCTQLCRPAVRALDAAPV
jgi:hypothetical protein